MKKLVVGIIALILLGIGVFGIVFAIETSAVSRNKEIVEFEVKKGNTYLTLATTLKEENLIKSDFFYKLYIKLNSPKAVEAGIYELSESMSVGDLVKVLSSGSNYNPDVVSFTIPEGKHLEEIAEIISSKTDYSSKELLNYWNSEEFIDGAINDYWFITDDVKQDGIKYSLEGYFFPATYEILNKSEKLKTISYKMLEKMNSVLSKYKDDIEKSEYSVHELLTLASIVEHEAILDEDRPIIAGVFYNRLNINMKLQSCATIGYAIDTWKLTYSYTDLQVNSPYNTYYYSGLPIGPGGMPGEKSIEATLYPEETEYFYFLANVCDNSDKKTYFSKNLDEHNEKKRLYLTCQN